MIKNDQQSKNIIASSIFNRKWYHNNDISDIYRSMKWKISLQKTNK